MTDALNEQICDDNVQSVEDVVSCSNAQEVFPDLKKGIKLQKSPLQWSTANAFFNSLFQITQSQLKKSIKVSIPWQQRYTITSVIITELLMSIITTNLNQSINHVRLRILKKY